MKKPHGMPNSIILALATQAELEYLYLKGHPFVYKDIEPQEKIKEDPESEVKKKEKPIIRKL